jgi:hypothetical protein
VKVENDICKKEEVVQRGDGRGEDTVQAGMRIRMCLKVLDHRQANT